MKFAFIGFVTVVAIGCSGEERSTYPTAPTPSVAAAPAPIPDQLASVSVSGQGLGRSVRQADRCSVWDPDYSANFKDLTPGAEMTLRASAEGYAPREVIVMPTPGPQVLRVEIELSRLQ
jgi:hypothetical protein